VIRLRGALVVIALLLAGCSAAPAATPATHRPAASPSASASARPTPTPAPTVAQIVTTAAQEFADQTVSGAFDAQWALLAPPAQALWPSQSARTAMLQAKFGGAALTSITLGPPTSGITWYDPESPAVSVPDTWRFPVRVSFADPDSLSPPGVAALFSMTQISVEYDSAAGTASVVGEGPASMDAPVIVPATVTSRQVDVPIFMYHLVENQEPQESAYGGNVTGWEIDVGLTTLTSQFQAEMAYASSIGATSISLQHLADALLYGLPLPPHSFVITFDDGRLSQWTNAAPILREYGFTAVFFPCTALVGGVYGPQQYVTAAELRELADTGFSFGDHTLKDNVALWTGDATSQQLEVVTDQSKTTLETLIGGQPIQFIAYSGPWPGDTQFSYTQQEAPLFSTLQSFGYVGGLQDLRDDSDDDVSTSLWQLPRVRVGLGISTASWGTWVEDAA
jgi:peptidoglycan/xylan/chitin deacetylase (PgdA/CDA1 family)